MRTELIKEAFREKPFYSVKQVFRDHWFDYKRANSPRQVEIEEVEKMLSCRQKCFVGYCKKCNIYEFVLLGCNSRICSCCGKRYTDQWADRLSRKVIKGIYHRHFTFSLPIELREPIKQNRYLQKIISDSALKTIKSLFFKIKKKYLMPGVIGVVHPFGKDLKFNPHVHCIVTEGGFTKDGRFVPLGRYIPYDLLHKEWQYVVLNELKKYLDIGFIDFLFRKYPNGFAPNVNPLRISGRELARYVRRYVRHPAIANSRVIGYNGEAVKFYYKGHEDKIHYKIMLTYDFISAIIQHIPDKNFRLVRYYGAYSRRRAGVIKQSIISDKILSVFNRKREIYCSKCGERMEIVLFSDKPPPKDMSKLSSWIELYSGAAR
jgi:hypothetical protein